MATKILATKGSVLGRRAPWQTQPASQPANQPDNQLGQARSMGLPAKPGVWVCRPSKVCVCVCQPSQECWFADHPNRANHKMATVGEHKTKTTNSQPYIYTPPNMEAQRATLAEMGLRAAKAIANHLLQENTYESNLVSDIAYAPYLRGNRGRTHLAPIPGFPPFCDDQYVYGRLQARDVVRVGNRVSCTTGETGSASLVVGRISNLSQEVWPRAEHKYIHVSIAKTVGVGAGGKICETIQAIEAGSGGKLEREWRAQHGGADPIAYFVAKLDVSELPIAVLHAGLQQFQQLLSANCMGLYQLDYTQDLSGTLDRPELVQHLEEAHHFYRQGERPPENPQGCILDNTGSVGDHVCTFVQTIGGRTTATKLYNKFVSQIEAGDVRGQFGGHMSGVVASTNDHLRQTLAHPDVLARGCTRVEISIYGCSVEELSPARADNMLARALQLATPEGDGADTGLFVVQPLAKLWENYASCLDRCLVLADRLQGKIYVSWSGNSKTGRTQGVLVPPTKAKVEDDVAWRKAIAWAMADFALRRCPIVLAEIRAVVDGVVEFAPLQCYTKDAPTILCASTRPCELHIDGPNLQELLPPTPTLEFRWRTQKAQRIGVALPSCELVEVPAMLEGRHLSTLSTRGRVSRLLELAEANNRILRAGQVQRFAREEHERNEQRRRDFERLEQATARARREQEKKQKLLQEIGAVDLCTKKVADHAGKEAFVLAYTETENGTKKVLLQTEDKIGQYTNPPNLFLRFWVWHTRGLGRILDSQAEFFEKVEKFRPWATLYWIPYAPAKNRPGLRIRIRPSKSFWTAGGQQIHWNPLELLSIPSEKGLASLRELLQNQETQDLLEQRRVLEQELAETDSKLERGLAPPRQKDCFPALAMEPGYYTVLRYAETVAYGKPRAIFYMSPRNADGRCDQWRQKPVRGVFLQEEVEKLGCPLAELEGKRLVCHLGEQKTTKAKKQCRLAQLFVLEDVA